MALCTNLQCVVFAMLLLPLLASMTPVTEFNVPDIALPVNASTETRHDIPNYKIIRPSKELTMIEVHGICVAPNNNFAAVSFNKHKRHYCIFDPFGNLLKDVGLPHYTGKMSDCVYISNEVLLLCDYSERKIYRADARTGRVTGVFASGYRCVRMAFFYGYVYVSEDVNNWVIIFNTGGTKVGYFPTGGPGGPRGMSFDTEYNIHVALHSNVVKKYTYEGYYLSSRSYPYLHFADGIVVDAANNIVITARRDPSTVVVFNKQGHKIQQYPHFMSAADADITYPPGRRPILLLVDNGSSKIRMYG